MALGIEFVVIVATVLLLLYYLSKNAHSYWKKRGIPFIPPKFLFGNLKDILFMQQSPIDAFQSYYDTAGNDPAIGMYLFYKPALLIKDVNLIKKILVKDFNSFADRFTAVDRHADILGYYNMFFLKNPEWKEVRRSITPVYTSKNLKQMFTLVRDIGNQLNTHLCGLKPDPRTNRIDIEAKDVSTLFTTDVIASTAFGIQANSFQNPDGDFRRSGKEIFTFPPLRALHFDFIFFQPFLGKLFKSKIFTSRNATFLRSAIFSALSMREKTGVPRNDLIDILLAMKKAEGKNDVKFNDDMLVAQAGVFFNAGYETASTTMAFAMYELCKNMQCQNRLREDIKQVLEATNGEITYDDIMGMEYLHMVISEVLRMYPPLPFLDRECTVPEGHSFEPELGFTVPKGMPVYIPIFSVHRDPQYFPDPDKFDPERFSPENKDNIVPYSYMPFGLGPHNCIGERLGLIQSKVGLINILRNHYVKPTSQTPMVPKLGNALLINVVGGLKVQLVRDPLVKEVE